MLDLLRRRENLCLEISFLHTQGGIERFARYFGAERVLFGTGYRSHQGASLAALAGADLTEADRGEIAHANLERLLGVAPLSAMSAAQPGRLSRFWDRLLAGERLGCDVIDAHGHLGPLGSYVTEECDTAAQARQALSWMDRLGVSAMIVSGSQALFTDPVEGNRALEETLAPHGERFRGYLAFNPSYAAELEPLIEDFFSRPFWAGLKLLCDYWGVPVTDPRFRPVWEYANAHRLPILIHSWGGSLDAPAMLREIVPAYPEAAFVLAHAGGPARREAEDLAVDHPNVYLEWCGSFTRPDSWEQTLARVGPGRVVFGTDAILHNFHWELGRLLSQDFSEEDLTAILGANMRGLLARRPGRGPDRGGG